MKLEFTYSSQNTVFSNLWNFSLNFAAQARNRWKILQVESSLIVSHEIKEYDVSGALAKVRPLLSLTVMKLPRCKDQN